MSSLESSSGEDTPDAPLSPRRISIPSKIDIPASRAEAKLISSGGRPEFAHRAAYASDKLRAPVSTYSQDCDRPRPASPDYVLSLIEARVIEVLRTKRLPSSACETSSPMITSTAATTSHVLCGFNEATSMSRRSIWLSRTVCPCVFRPRVTGAKAGALRVSYSSWSSSGPPAGKAWPRQDYFRPIRRQGKMSDRWRPARN